jgi:opacity protein-like surface antigen
MKKIAIPFVACLALASSAFAGHEMKEMKQPVPTEPCFKDQELQLDVFGSWADTRRHDNVAGPKDGWGGGLGVNYFFMRYLGVGADANIVSASNGLWTFSGSLIARYPIEAGSLCLAPYILGGGGFQTDGINAGTWHVGGGLEWRATHNVGIYGEGRYTWAGAHEEDSVRVSLGVRFIF